MEPMLRVRRAVRMGPGTHRGRRPGSDGGPGGVLSAASLLVAALVTGLAEQLAVLLLGHPLAALLDH
ncbi:hypothetical protein GCM10009767_34870 [Kocuria aegyptia]|uniref:Uncharacterized protein n=1 Tax=Kocuria aegyptia TaxID=330943 RepID=A0ABN2L489_9MICC